jgi:hypothetical protein
MARLRLAVVGTGPGWDRWKAALASLRGEVRVAGIHGPGEGDSGAVDLIRRPDTDAVLLGRAWFGAWPLAHALEAGKPVLCTIPVSASDLDGLTGRVTFAPWPALDLAAGPLAEALAGLGPVRTLQVCGAWPGAPLDVARVPPLLLLAAALLGDPAEVRALGRDPVSVQIRHAEGWSQLAFAGGAAAPRCVVRAEAEAGAATLEMPRRLEWQDAAGRHARELASGMAEVAALERFVRDVRSGAGMGLERMRAALGWLASRAAARP